MITALLHFPLYPQIDWQIFSRHSSRCIHNPQGICSASFLFLEIIFHAFEIIIWVYFSAPCNLSGQVASSFFFRNLSVIFFSRSSSIPDATAMETEKNAPVSDLILPNDQLYNAPLRLVFVHMNGPTYKNTIKAFWVGWYV
jgi:hypothetical protein